MKPLAEIKQILLQLSRQISEGLTDSRGGDDSLYLRKGALKEDSQPL